MSVPGLLGVRRDRDGLHLRHRLGRDHGTDLPYGIGLDYGVEFDDTQEYLAGGAAMRMLFGGAVIGPPVPQPPPAEPVLHDWQAAEDADQFTVAMGTLLAFAARAPEQCVRDAADVIRRSLSIDTAS